LELSLINGENGVKLFEQRLELAKVILQQLSREPCTQSVLETRVLGKAGTHKTYTNMFYFLRNSGFITKKTSEHRAPFALCKKGELLLEALSS
jgi:predicted transcriptional regulator